MRLWILALAAAALLAGAAQGVTVGSGLPKNYPNPFNETTRIAFDLPRGEAVTLEIYDLSGRRVQTLTRGWRSAGRHEVNWQATGHSSGVYFCRIEAGNWTQARKMILLK